MISETSFSRYSILLSLSFAMVLIHETFFSRYSILFSLSSTMARMSSYEWERISRRLTGKSQGKRVKLTLVVPNLPFPRFNFWEADTSSPPPSLTISFTSSSPPSLTISCEMYVCNRSILVRALPLWPCLLLSYFYRQGIWWIPFRPIPLISSKIRGFVGISWD